jgi:hypothetical protein
MHLLKNLVIKIQKNTFGQVGGKWHLVIVLCAGQERRNSSLENDFPTNLVICAVKLRILKNNHLKFQRLLEKNLADK